MKTLVALALMTATAVAETCPEPVPIEAEMDRIFSQMKAVPDEMSARVLNSALWEMWLEAPDEASQMMLDVGMERMRVSDFEAAETELTTLVYYCPWYAEGWNQRAFTYFLTERYELALADLEQALKANPRHLGALSGKALTLIRLDRNAEAQPVLREALALNPWMNERHLLTDEDL